MIASPDNCPPSRVIDANGLEWKHMRWVNTQTGEGEQIVVNENGEKQLNPEMTDVLTQKVSLASPVIVVPIHPKWDTKEKWDAALRVEELAIGARDA